MTVRSVHVLDKTRYAVTSTLAAAAIGAGAVAVHLAWGPRGATSAAARRATTGGSTGGS